MSLSRTPTDLPQQMTSLRLWIVGKELDYTVSSWEFQGVFATESDARAACKTERYFIGPARLNRAVPDRGVKWKGAYYPKVASDQHRKE